MGDKTDVWLGTLSLMVLKTLETLGPLHGYGIVRRIESKRVEHVPSLNHDTACIQTAKLEQEGAISSERGVGNNLKASSTKLKMRAGKKQLDREARDREQTTAHPGRFLRPGRGGAMRHFKALVGTAARDVRRRAGSRESSAELESHLQMHMDEQRAPRHVS